MLKIYLVYGVGFYCGLAIARRSDFADSTPFAIFKGLVFGILLWPAAVIWEAKTH